MDHVYLNGRFIRKEEATVSIFDRGLLFGDAVYEVIPYFNGNALEALPHLERLNRSIESIQMKPVLSNEEWLSIFSRLTELNQQQNQSFSIYLQVTRGSTGTRSHAIPPQVDATVIVYLLPPSFMDSQRPRHIITRPDQRHAISHIKSTNLLANVLAHDQARAAGAIEAVLYRGETIIECTSSNIFIVKDDCIRTPELRPCMLAGITRSLVLDLAASSPYSVEESAVTLDELYNANEVWITSSTKKMIPIGQVDNKIINRNQIGPVTQFLQNALEKRINAIG